VQWSINTVLNIGAGSKLINVILKELVFVQDAGMSMKVFLIRLRNYYLKHFAYTKVSTSLYRCDFSFTRGTILLFITKGDPQCFQATNGSTLLM
jgi:hypothetical protein